MRDAKTGLSATLDEAQRDRVLITRNGKPSAIVIGVEGREFEDVLLMSNPRFWEMIEASRKTSKMYSMDEVRRHFAQQDASDKETQQRQGRRKPPPNKALQRTGRKASRR
jgi:prevent-host-death family protein